MTLSSVENVTSGKLFHRQAPIAERLFLPRRGNHPELLHQPQHILHPPVLHNLAVDQPHERYTGEGNGFTGGLDTLKFPRMPARQHKAPAYFIAVSDDILNSIVQLSKGVTDDVKEIFHPLPSRGDTPRLLDIIRAEIFINRRLVALSPNLVYIVGHDSFVV